MKANELMIGDLVRDITNKHSFKIEAILPAGFMRYTNDGSVAVPYNYEEIEPIPLTDAILEANGFHYHHKNFASLGYGHPFSLRMCKWPDENGRDGLWTIGELIDIRFVHELQHALRLCGIDKEIRLKE